MNRLDYGTTYCKTSPTVNEERLHEAIVRALNKFNNEDSTTYLALMKATISDALGLNGSSDEIDLLERKIESLNRKILELVETSVKNGGDIEEHDIEFRELSAEIELTKSRINTIRESLNATDSAKDRMNQIQEIIDERSEHPLKYDDAIVRQMIECIKVYHDGKLEIIFGGGYIIEEELS